MNASLENSMVVNATAFYESQHLEVTDEEESAMRELEAKQLQAKRNSEIAKLAGANPSMLRGQVIEAISDAGNGFSVYLHQAINSGDECLVGKLVMRCLSDYRLALAIEEVG